MALSHLVTGVGSFRYSLLMRLTFVPVCYAREKAISQCPRCQKLPSSKVTDLLKAWMEESRKQELRHEEERRRCEQERTEEKRRYEQERAKERLRYEELIRGVTTGRPRRVEVGPESLKLTKLRETNDIEAFLTTFERAVEAHGVERDKRAAILAP